MSNQLAANLAAGVDTISESQEIEFHLYERRILPLDGFAFWVRSDALEPPVSTARKVKGSLHYTTDNKQDEAEGYSTNNMIFTSLVEIDFLNDVAPQTVWIANFDGIRFAFSHRSSLYRQAQLFHYQGFAVYPTMETQLIEPGDTLNLEDIVVSNSLPIWLGLNQFFPMWPSFLIPDNIVPPYCAVHIDPNFTTALQSAPRLDVNRSHFQLAQDRVRLTLYGVRNAEALDFQDYFNDYSINTDRIGVLNQPIMRDEKSTQSELTILAQKKTIEYEVSYYQSTVRAAARQLIVKALCNIIIQGI